MKKYCEKCEKEVVPALETYNSQFEYGNRTYKYRAFRGFCPECNGVVDKEPQQDVKSRENTFRKMEGIITTTQINEILDKYQITSEKLSESLNWDKRKVEGYLCGDMPTYDESETLLELLENENYAKDILNL